MKPTSQLPLVDYHSHSNLSADGVSPMADTCAVAVRRGITHLAFTEHFDAQPDDPGYGFHNYDNYMATLGKCREQFGDRLTLPAAVEISYQPEFAADIEAFLAAHPFQFVIGSVHAVRKQFMWLREYYERHTAAEMWQMYFEDVRKSAATGWFDVLGHLDVPKRYSRQIYGPFQYDAWAEHVDAVLRACVESGTGIEINTSGIRQGVGETLPGLAVLRRYRELGGEILTVGSDSHVANDIGADIATAYELAREAGFKAIAIFTERRNPTFLDL